MKNIYLNINFKNNINYASCQCDLMVISILIIQNEDLIQNC